MIQLNNKLFELTDNDTVKLIPDGCTGSMGVSCNIGGVNSASYNNTHSNTSTHSYRVSNHSKHAISTVGIISSTTGGIPNVSIKGITGISGSIGIVGPTGSIGPAGSNPKCSNCDTQLTLSDYDKSIKLRDQGIPLNKIPQWTKGNKHLIETKEEFYNIVYMCSSCKRELTLDTIIGPII